MRVSEDHLIRVSAVMTTIGRDRFDELEKRLVEGTAKELSSDLDMAPLDEVYALHLIEAARAEFEQGEAILRVRKELHQHIEDAQTSIRKAEKAVAGLWDDWGDVEYESGHADTERFLKEAARNLRGAQAIKPSGKDGELR